MPPAFASSASLTSSIGAPPALRASSQAGSATIADSIHGFILATLAAGMPRSSSALETAAASSGDISDASVVPSVNIISSGSAASVAIILAWSRISVVSMTTVSAASKAFCAAERQLRHARVRHMHRAEEVGRLFAGLFQLPQQAMPVRRRGGFASDLVEQRRIALFERRQHVGAAAGWNFGPRLAGDERDCDQERDQEQHIDRGDQLQSQRCCTVGDGDGAVAGSCPDF